MYIHICVCVYIYIYICTHIHIIAYIRPDPHRGTAVRTPRRRAVAAAAAAAPCSAGSCKSQHFYCVKHICSYDMWNPKLWMACSCQDPPKFTKSVIFPSEFSIHRLPYIVYHTFIPYMFYHTSFTMYLLPYIFSIHLLPKASSFRQSFPKFTIQLFVSPVFAYPFTGPGMSRCSCDRHV